MLYLYIKYYATQAPDLVGNSVLLRPNVKTSFVMALKKMLYLYITHYATQAPNLVGKRVHTHTHTH